MYSFAQRSDTQVVDEPFYAVYLLASGAAHPGRKDVLRAQPHTEKEVRTQLGAMSKKPVLFIKNMAHHMEVLSRPMIEHDVNVFLIRNPKQILASYSKVIERPVMRDIGIAYQYQLFSQLKENGRQPVVVDSGHLLQNPESVLQKLCRSCDIPFENAMLSWKQGAKPYDGVWAPYWYGNVHRSSGFESNVSAEHNLDDALMPLYEEARAIYEKLLPFSLKA